MTIVTTNCCINFETFLPYLRIGLRVKFSYKVIGVIIIYLLNFDLH